MTTDMRSQFDQYIENFKQNTSKEVQDKMRNAIDELENSEEGNGLSEGEKAPDFTLPDAKGGQVQLSEQLKFGPVIVTFYRGGWCPYCNMELRAYQEILDDIHKEGAQLIAISPQTPDQSMTTQEKNDLQYHVLSDVGNKAARQFNLVYKLPDYLVEVYKDKGLNVDKHNGDDSWTLPVSATYIIDTDGSIVYEYTKSDYKDRAEPSEVLQELKKVKA
ncbi:AhpC/TSA family protein [Bacillus sp. SB49]|uniref:peroxiredoxin-like family protein n=1 Tax=Bacillaceae TaxID=186817 RepID=UPI0002A51472|nr:MULTISPECIES: peroxiredoxin-like family protein [Bacillaceae]ELK48717.1 redoxin [Halobacillus sp. BAB-2008]QHT45346.1 AhpC/TSA family protein [Bacillus sp. SB49]